MPISEPIGNVCGDRGRQYSNSEHVTKTAPSPNDQDSHAASYANQEYGRNSRMPMPPSC